MRRADFVTQEQEGARAIAGALALAQAQSATQASGGQAIPQNFLLDHVGKIVAANLRSEGLQTTLARPLNKAN